MNDFLSRRTLLASLAAFAGAAALPGTAFALTEEEEIVDRCRISVQSMLSDPNFGELTRYISKARGVMIFPALLKGGFIIGGEGGSGVLLARLGDGTWSYPAFYFLGAASIGLQIGGQVSETVLTYMNDDSVDRVLRNKFKLGADASIAVGPVGKGLETGTAGGFDSDIYVFARSEGLFGGVSLEGGVLEVEDGRMQYYYGERYSARDVVRDNKGRNVHADSLRAALPR